MMFLRKSQMSPSRYAAFSLIEMSIVLVLMSLVMGAGLHVLNDQLERRRESVTRDRLNEARKALLHFASIHGRLPCPAADMPLTDFQKIGGWERHLADGRCEVADGFLPALTLGFTETDQQGYSVDGWSRRANRLRYAIAQRAYPSSGGDGCSSSDGQGTDISRALVGIAEQGDTLPADKIALFKVYKGQAPFTQSLKRFNLCVCASMPCLSSAAGMSAAAVVYSLGKNGFMDEKSFGSEEQENLNQDRFFVYHMQSPAFDDTVLWISSDALWGALQDAGFLSSQ